MWMWYQMDIQLSWHNSTSSIVIHITTINYCTMQAKNNHESNKNPPLKPCQIPLKLFHFNPNKF